MKREKIKIQNQTQTIIHQKNNGLIICMIEISVFYHHILENLYHHVFMIYHDLRRKDIEGNQQYGITA